jgi:antagonist of KipI
MNQTLIVAAGSRLRFGSRRSGVRAYLAVEGGIDVPKIFGSRATHVTSRIGGIDGRALVAGDCLRLGGRHRKARSRAVDVRALTELGRGRSSIRVMAGPNHESFTADALDVLQSAPYVVGANSNRMGYRLEGPALKHTRGGDIISDATPLGAVQVPASGQPILLMADRATTGGYPKIATVIAADISRAGQLGPGDSLSFSVCSRRDALGALVAQERLLMALEARAAS